MILMGSGCGVGSIGTATVDVEPGLDTQGAGDTDVASDPGPLPSDGCEPTTCDRAGKNCDDIPNGCGGILHCGPCTLPAVCGGGGTANVCGTSGQCTPDPNMLTVRANTVTKYTAMGQSQWVVVPANYDTTCHSRAKKLFVWLHGCYGTSEWDVTLTMAEGSEDWITLAPGGAEGGCWSYNTTEESYIMSVIEDLKSRLAVDPTQVSIGGYSSGGIVGGRIIFHNSKKFALGLFENADPTFDVSNPTQYFTDLLAAAAPPAGFRFAIRHVCHTGDTGFPCSDAQARFGTSGLAAAAGHDSVAYSMPGDHYDSSTWADFNSTLRPFLSQTFVSPP